MTWSDLNHDQLRYAKRLMRQWEREDRERQNAKIVSPLQDPGDLGDLAPRSDATLHSLPVSEWSEEEVFIHLRETFDRACKDFPDQMEAYVNRISDIDDRAELKLFMRLALRETFWQRARQWLEAAA